MVQHLKLTYFDIKGRAELSRMLFHYGDVAFVDERLSPADFGAMKPSLPNGQVPVLEIDGFVYAHSMAIALYAAKMAGLYPSDPVKALKSDMLSYTIAELDAECTDFLFFTPDESEKTKKMNVYIEKSVPKTLAVLEKLVEGKFLLGDSISFADVQTFDYVENCIKSIFPSFEVTGFPKLVALIKNVASDPKVAAYLAKSK